MGLLSNLNKSIWNFLSQISRKREISEQNINLLANLKSTVIVLDKNIVYHSNCSLSLVPLLHGISFLFNNRMVAARIGKGTSEGWSKGGGTNVVGYQESGNGTSYLRWSRAGGA